MQPLYNQPNYNFNQSNVNQPAININYVHEGINNKCNFN